MWEEYRESVIDVSREFFKDIAVFAFGTIAVSHSLLQLLFRTCSCILFYISLSNLIDITKTMDLNQLNQIIDRGYIWAILLTIAFLVAFKTFDRNTNKKKK
jgi:hypothetical protein